MCHRVPRHLHQPHPRQGRQVSVSAIPVHTSIQIITQDSRLLHYLIREIKTWLNSNHITVHNNTYILKLKEQLLKIQKLRNKQTSNLRNSHTHTHTHTHTHAYTALTLEQIYLFRNAIDCIFLNYNNHCVRFNYVSLPGIIIIGNL